MKEMIFEIRVQPDLLKFGLNQDKIQRSVNEWLVLSLFTDGLVSSGKAGKLLGITRIDFLDLLQRRGIAYLDYSPQELDEEFEAVRLLETNKPE
jgi:predicted HTH domain antitoxin